MELAAYWALSVMFCAGWIASTITVYRTGWNRVSPWFCRWLVVQSAQAVMTTIGGPNPSLWWARHIWLPGEAVALAALCFVLAEILPQRLALIAAVTGLVLVPIFHGFQPPAPQMLAEFAKFREWIWATTGVALWIHLGMLLWHPLRLAPGAFRSWVILAGYATAIAILTPVGSTGVTWLSTRSVYRACTIVCCLSWIKLAPMMQEAAREPEPDEDSHEVERSAVACFSWLPAPRLIRGLTTGRL